MAGSSCCDSAEYEVSVLQVRYVLSYGPNDAQTLLLINVIALLGWAQVGAAVAGNASV